MTELNENAAIPMDGTAVEYDSTPQLLPEGEYFFTVMEMKREQCGSSEKMPPHINVKFRLKLTNGELTGHAWDNLRMYQKWIWKYADIAKSIGHTAPDSTLVRVDWAKFVGSEGKVKVTLKDWTRNDGTVEKQYQFKYLLPAGDIPTEF